MYLHLQTYFIFYSKVYFNIFAGQANNYNSTHPTYQGQPVVGTVVPPIVISGAQYNTGNIPSKYNTCLHSGPSCVQHHNKSLLRKI